VTNPEDKAVKVALVCVAFASAFFLVPKAARAANACGAIAETLPTLMDSAVSRADDPDPSQSDVAYSSKLLLQQGREAEALCKSGPKAVYVLALLDAWIAWQRHWNGSDADGIHLEQAIEQLTNCASHYFGTDEGATCAQWQKRMIA
jgi:hypothetical protein